MYKRKNAPIRAQKKANMFKAKKLIENVGTGTSYLKQVPCSLQQTITDHCLYLSIELKKFLSQTYSCFINMAHYRKPLVIQRARVPSPVVTSFLGEVFFGVFPHL